MNTSEMLNFLNFLKRKYSSLVVPKDRYLIRHLNRIEVSFYDASLAYRNPNKYAVGYYQHDQQCIYLRTDIARVMRQEYKLVIIHELAHAIDYYYRNESPHDAHFASIVKALSSNTREYNIAKNSHIPVNDIAYNLLGY